MGDSPTTYRTKAFISYSHADKAYLERLQKHLKPDLHEGAIRVWDDTQIPPGGDWLAAIERALAEAQVAILLVSADFLASDFVTKVELPKILAAARDEGAMILLVFLRHSRFRQGKLSQFQGVNDPDKPLDSLSESDREKIWSQVAELTVNALRAKKEEWREKVVNLYHAAKFKESLVACGICSNSIHMMPLA